MAQMNSPALIKNFVEGGKAIFTLESAVTGTHFTFKVIRRENIPGMFVNLLSGPNNLSDYTYLGALNDAGDLRLTPKSRVSASAPSFKAFEFFAKTVLKNLRKPETLIVRHEGRCGRCGRPLTTPESIDAGFGPECIKHV